MGLISSSTRGGDLVSTCVQPQRGGGCTPVVSRRARPGVDEIRATPWRILLQYLPWSALIMSSTFSYPACRVAYLKCTRSRIPAVLPYGYRILIPVGVKSCDSLIDCVKLLCCTQYQWPAKWGCAKLEVFCCQSVSQSVLKLRE